MRVIRLYLLQALPWRAILAIKQQSQRRDMMQINKLWANSNAHGGSRNLSAVRAIVLHYSGNNGDTAKNNAVYFRDSNTRSAGAHFFVDQKGEVYQSVKMDKIAWSVGGNRYSDYRQTGGARYYGIYNNANTVSIEMCDTATKDPSAAMISATKALIKHIRGKCKNAALIIRHFDVTGKDCPARFTNTAKWNKLLEQLGESASKIKTGNTATENTKSNATKTAHFLVKVLVDNLKIRKGPGLQYTAVGAVNTGDVYTIVDTSQDGWGKLKSGAGWIKITSKYVKRV